MTIAPRGARPTKRDNGACYRSNEFGAALGYRHTTMADVAAVAGVSRPALYQYFDDRADLFRAAFDAVLQDAADAALAALEAGGTVAERFDSYLQRAYGDGYEALSSTPFGAELMDARHEFAADVAEAAAERTRRGLRRFVGSLATGPAATRAQVIDLLTLSPAGLKADQPAAAVYRSRLGVLARAAAGLLASARPARADPDVGGGAQRTAEGSE